MHINIFSIPLPWNTKWKIAKNQATSCLYALLPKHWLSQPHKKFSTLLNRSISFSTTSLHSHLPLIVGGSILIVAAIISVLCIAKKHVKKDQDPKDIPSKTPIVPSSAHCDARIILAKEDARKNLTFVAQSSIFIPPHMPKTSLEEEKENLLAAEIEKLTLAQKLLEERIKALQTANSSLRIARSLEQDKIAVLLEQNATILALSSSLATLRKHVESSPCVATYDIKTTTDSHHHALSDDKENRSHLEEKRKEDSTALKNPRPSLIPTMRTPRSSIHTPLNVLDFASGSKSLPFPPHRASILSSI